MKVPVKFRKGIPLFYDKQEAEFKQDPYERYDPTVLRQCSLHLCDQLWEKYPQQPVLDFAESYLPEAPEKIVEVGCGVGRWVASLSQQYPDASCWGMDYSYQMLRQAQDYWCKGLSLHIDLSSKGHTEPISKSGHTLRNLNFGLSQAEALPFDDHSQDLLVHSFLFDRLAQPMQVMAEFTRVLKPGGIMIFATPLNFHQPGLWRKFYPPVKLFHALSSIAEILDWQETILIEEPLDQHGNRIQWNCLGVALRVNES